MISVQEARALCVLLMVTLGACSGGAPHQRVNGDYVLTTTAVYSCEKETCVATDCQMGDIHFKPRQTAYGSVCVAKDAIP